MCLVLLFFFSMWSSSQQYLWREGRLFLTILWWATLNSIMSRSRTPQGQTRYVKSTWGHNDFVMHWCVIPLCYLGDPSVCYFTGFEIETKLLIYLFTLGITLTLKTTVLAGRVHNSTCSTFTGSVTWLLSKHPCRQHCGPCWGVWWRKVYCCSAAGEVMIWSLCDFLIQQA